MKHKKTPTDDSWYNFWVATLVILLALDFGGVYGVYRYGNDCVAVLECNPMDFVLSVTLIIVMLGVPLISYYRVDFDDSDGSYSGNGEREDNPEWYEVCVLDVMHNGRKTGVTLPLGIDALRKFYSSTVNDRLVNRRKMERLGVCRQAVFKQLLLNLRSAELVEKHGRSWYATDSLVEAMRILLLD